MNLGLKYAFVIRDIKSVISRSLQANKRSRCKQIFIANSLRKHYRKYRSRHGVCPALLC